MAIHINTEFLKDKLHRNKQGDFDFQRRRHPQWTENYELYRDTVIVNRLTQRQSVNIPLMKETVKTILAGIDDDSKIEYEELDNDEQKQIFFNEYWTWTADQNKLELKDVVDKKQVLLYGRSFWKMNIVDGAFYSEVIDPQDILVDRYCDPTDIETAQHLIHQHIFRNLKDVQNNPLYDQQAVQRIGMQYATEGGLIKAAENTQSMIEKNQRMKDMGDVYADFPEVGETIIELNEHYVKLWDEEKKEFVLHLVTMADQEILLNKPLKEILNIDFFPFVTWADDLERTDFWSDAWGDVVRTPNKILNAYFSQMVENRTMRNFGMNYYDSTMQGFVPQSFEPQPWGWVPIPVPEGKKIADVFQKVDIPDLGRDSLDEMQFIIDLVERATAATDIQKGEPNKDEITLGEVKLLAANAQQRISSMSKFYRQARREFGDKWQRMVTANSDKLKPVKVFKKSYKGKMFSQDISPKDWKSEVGYNVRVVNSSEQDQKNLDTVQKLGAIKQLYPHNIPLARILEEKLLDVANVSPEQKKEVMDFEKQAAKQAQAQAQPGQTAPSVSISFKDLPPAGKIQAAKEAGINLGPQDFGQAPQQPQPGQAPNPAQQPQAVTSPPQPTYA